MKSIDQWEKAIKIDPKFVDGLNNLGNAYFKNENLMKPLII